MLSSPPNAQRVDGPPRIGALPRRSIALAFAALAAAGAFVLYYSTLLPGVDFGDSGSFQTTVGLAELRTRDAYPLYFAIGRAILAVSQAGPARALNLASALEGAAACGLFVLVGVELTGSIAAALAGAFLFATSYTFWSQCVTAEVYALHIALVLASILLILRWARAPTTRRLAVFFACYALAFGNHLAMILLAPAFTLFLFLSEPRGWRALLTPRVVGLAVLLAAAGAAQYAWNIRSLWLQPDAPRSIADALASFWFDVTKADWRETMVLRVPDSMLADRWAMVWFDLRQQFGVAGIVAAAAGFVASLRRPKQAALPTLAFAANFAFAFTYEVGDAHVFFLPCHLLFALWAAQGAAAAGDLARRWNGRRWGLAAAVALAGYAAARGYRDYPALDRSRDARPSHLLSAMTANADDRHAVLLTDLNWQIANGLSYFLAHVRPDVAAVRMRDVLLYAPALIRDNLAIGRTVVMTPDANRLLRELYGPLFAAEIDQQPESFADVARQLQAGTRYVLCILKPTRGFSIDPRDLAAAIRILTGGDVQFGTEGYTAIAGIVGARPDLVAESNAPFARGVTIRGVPVEIRMESWLGSDTIRRMGFGHVIASRHHTLIVERGISFVAIDDGGEPLQTLYESGIFAEMPRYLIQPAVR